MRIATSGTRIVGALAAVATGAMLVLVGTPASAADPCAPGGNPIVCENSKPGTDPSVWDVEGAGNDDIQGFATDISVNVGSRIDFKIKTTSRNYTIDIYRTGWYGGLGARKITSVSPSVPLPQVQPECVSDVATELYDCGNWAVSASWNVPSTAVSGVYIAKLTDVATGDDSHIIFVVRNDASHSQVVFQTSDPTWEAYNSYGGSDFYQGAANGRAYKISYNRPFATRGGVEKEDFYFGNEYPMVRFLERNGYDLTYIAGVDTDRAGALLKNHKVFLSVGHDEYWSAAQRSNVEAARDAGVNLAFFSGNEVYWHTRYEPAYAGAATPYRTLVSYKETWSNAKIDPTNEWTGTWRDPRFSPPSEGGGVPENSLTGTFFLANNADLPITVTAEQGKFRVWRGTSLTSLAPGTQAELAQHTVGYESDEDTDNGFRPAGLIDMSTTTGPSASYIQDFGTLTAPGQTTHHITMYRAASGALVFGAGTIQWSWGLDQEHDGDGDPADPRIQQATVNLLADMSAQPSTLMTGLVAATASTDTTGPTVAITSPASGSTLANGTVTTVTGTATDSGGGRVAGVEVSTDGGTSWHPASGTSTWSYSYTQTGTGSASIRVRAMDDSANIGPVAARSISSNCPCSIYGQTAPKVADAGDASPVELGLTFTPSQDGFITGVRFYKAAGNTGQHVGSLWSTTGQKLASVTFTGETASGWQTATFASAVPVAAGTSYVVSYTAPNGHYAVESDAFWYRGRSAPPLSVAGGFGHSSAGVYAAPGQFPVDSYAASQYYVDAVYSATDITPLTMSTPAPLDGAGSVATTVHPSIVLSRPVTAGSVVMTVTSASGAKAAGTTAYDATTRIATFTPSSPLSPATTYAVAVSATSSVGPLTGASTWSFTTAAAPQAPGARTVSFYDDSDVPAVLDEPDVQAVTVGVRFSSTTSGTVTGVRFYKGPTNVGTHVGALWSVDGRQLAQGTFTNETTTGWQTLTFATPVHIDAGTQYVASYRTPVGQYAGTPDAFSGTGVQRGPLHTDASSGAYSYSDAYPSGTSTTSYMVDVIFVQDAQALTVVGQSPTPDNPGASSTSPIAITVSSPLAAGASLTLKKDGTAVGGTFALSADGLTLSFAPSAALATATTYTATAKGLVSTDGAALADQTWTFTTADATGCPCTAFGSAIPATAAANDSRGVELGVSFTPSVSGVVTGVRFYKGAGNDGTHTGTLWSSTGVPLATVTFTSESASGWQTASFATPYEVDAGTTYVVSYFAPAGHYSVTSGAFTQDQVTGPITVPAAGNGRYRYDGGFPTDSWQQTNYFVDIVFMPAAPNLPTATPVTPASGATGVSRFVTVTATLSKAPRSGSPTLTLNGPDGNVAGTSTYSSATTTVSFAPTTPLAAGSTFTVSATLDGTPLAGSGWSFTTSAAPPTSLWNDTDVPANPASSDYSAVQVGTRFTASTAGTVTAIRFYKGAANTGAHTVNLWSSTGALLGTAVSTSETASGWQTVLLQQPVPIVSGQTYTASYFSSSGQYAYDSGALAAARSVGPLTTTAPGGAYVYDTGFPASSSTAWYGVDLVFYPSS